MTKENLNTKSMKTGLALILTGLLILGSGLSAMAAPKHDNFNQKAYDAVDRAGGKGIVNSNPNSALHGNGNSSTDETTIGTDETKTENDGPTQGTGDNQTTPPNNGGGEDNNGNNNPPSQPGQEGNDDVTLPVDEGNTNNEVGNGDAGELEESGELEEVTVTIESDPVPQGSGMSEGAEVMATEDYVEIQPFSVPLSAPDLNEVIILDEAVPQSAPALPQTGDANPWIMVITGLGLALTGLMIRRQ